MSSVFELLFDTYGDHLMQEQVPYDEAEIQAALDRTRILFLTTCVGLRYGRLSLSAKLFSPSSRNASLL